MNTPLHDIVSNSRKLAATTKKVYKADLDRWIEFAGKEPALWTTEKAEAFYTTLLDSGVKPQSAKRVMMSIRYAASWWAQKQGKPELDFTQIEFARDRRRAVKKALTEEQARAMLIACMGSNEPRDLRDFALVVTELETGMRVMSLHGMLIERTGVREQDVPVSWVPLKGQPEDYPVPTSDTVLAALTPWLAFLRARGVTSGPIFRSVLNRLDKNARIGGVLSHRALYDVITERATAAGLEGIHPHLFRHTFITWRIQMGLAPEYISAVTGHRLSNNLGVMFTYIDRRGPIAEEARSKTPPWLAELVDEWRRGLDAQKLKKGRR